MESIGPHGLNEQSALEQADAARKAGDLNSAIPLYGRALQENPDSVQAKLGLGQSYLSLGAGGEAAAQFRDVLAKHSGDTAAHRGLAAALIAQGQPALAEKQVEAVLQADARDFRALNVMGVSLDMQGRHVEAQTRYRQGIELSQDYIPLRSNLGLSLAISGQAPEAVALLAPLASSDTKARENLAFAYAMAGDFTNALQLLRRDMNEPSAQRQLSYYIQLRSLPPDQRSVAVRANPNFFPQSSRG
ncbi:MAG TPA: tetratricopeptide repeat protein [Reyranella sp.]|nr:tetratricopeptide repeat protein [Reyranella sp.]